jgi:poly(A) polymerase
MTEPRVVPREEHSLSRRDIDPDALKVLYRLRQGDHVAYLVGGSVRDLLLGRRPKDFDIGTSAHPYEVKKLFRNCWIIGRRFRLAHVKFGAKVIEVATFRRQVQAGEDIAEDGVPVHREHTDGAAEPLNAEELPEAASLPDTEPAETDATDAASADREHLIHRDNTFGTPEEDAFRRDFTINALFYDIGTFAIIDYTGGLDDLRAGIVRCIGDPEVRFREDPVRMLRAVALAARLDFTIDAPIVDAIRSHRHEIARSSPARLLEEYYKILRTGSAEKTFRGLADVGLLEPISAELHNGAGDGLWLALARVDAYRAQFESVPQTFSNAVLLGSLLLPLGLAPIAGRAPNRDGDDSRREYAPAPRLGALPLARRDVEHLRHLLSMQRRLHDVEASSRAKHALMERAIFPEALAWLEIHDDAPAVAEHWQLLMAEPTEQMGMADSEMLPPRRRRRRRRRRFGPTG